MQSDERRAEGTRLRDELRPAGPVDFGLCVYEGGNQTVLVVRGELDALTAPRLGAEIGELVRQRHGDVLVDLRNVSFIDSTGIHVLLNAHRRLSRQSRGLTVLCDQGPVRRTIELARLAETLGLPRSGDETSPPRRPRRPPLPALAPGQSRRRPRRP